MQTSEIIYDLERIHEVNDRPINYEGEYVVYWMQSSQRAKHNHALEYAVDKSNELEKNLIVYLGLTDNYPEANERHYYFMLEGLMEVKEELEKRNIRMIILKGSPEKEIIKLDKAAIIVVDDGYMKHEKSWRMYVSKQVKCKFVKIETNVIVPISVASDKEEYSAATLRRKIEKVVHRFLNLPGYVEYNGEFETKLNFENEILLNNVENVIKMLNINKNVKRVTEYVGGTSNAEVYLENFLETKLEHYDLKRNDPASNYCSQMSPYLHFGQISPIYIYIRVREQAILKSNLGDAVKAYLEELLVRRELAFNFVNYNDQYDNYECLPNWAKLTLEAHLHDEREYIYSLETLESGSTHDEYWNSAQKELVCKGKMHGYMRMYWGKKVIEWTKNPREAYNILIYLNNKYELDGRDPNGFAGVAWCFGKHDRPWTGRNIFGNVRYMAYSGLKRKFKMDDYVNKYNL